MAFAWAVEPSALSEPLAQATVAALEPAEVAAPPDALVSALELEVPPLLLLELQAARASAPAIRAAVAPIRNSFTWVPFVNELYEPNAMGTR
jgi:hypothetical protein